MEISRFGSLENPERPNKAHLLIEADGAQRVALLLRQSGRELVHKVPAKITLLSFPDPEESLTSKSSTVPEVLLSVLLLGRAELGVAAADHLQRSLLSSNDQPETLR